MKKRQDIFTRFATKMSMILGRAWVFSVALVALLLWGLSGPLLGFSDTWQLIVNTTTTIITFLMVFIIQNTQNRDNLAMNIKLDAIMQKHGITSEDMIEAEDKSDERLERDTKVIQNKMIKKKKAKKRS